MTLNVGPRLLGPFLVLLSATVCVIIAGFQSSEKARSDRYATKEDLVSFFESQDKDSPWPKKEATKTESELPEKQLSAIFESRLKAYKEKLADINTNLFYQLMFIVASIALVMTGINEFKIPKVDISIHARWVYLAIPICLCFLWIKFGYLLSSLIDYRLALWKLSTLMEWAIETTKHKGGSNGAPWDRLYNTISLRPILEDGSFLDGWIAIHYSQGIRGGNKQPELSLLWASMSLFVVFLGIGHGSALGLIFHSYKRFIPQQQNYSLSGLQRLLEILDSLSHLCYFVLCSGILLTTHAVFFNTGNPSILDLPLLISMCVVTFFYLIAPVKKPP